MSIFPQHNPTRLSSFHSVILSHSYMHCIIKGLLRMNYHILSRQGMAQTTVMSNNFTPHFPFLHCTAMVVTIEMELVYKPSSPGKFLSTPTSTPCEKSWSSPLAQMNYSGCKWRTDCLQSTTCSWKYILLGEVFYFDVFPVGYVDETTRTKAHTTEFKCTNVQQFCNHYQYFLHRSYYTYSTVLFNGLDLFMHTDPCNATHLKCEKVVP